MEDKSDIEILREFARSTNRSIEVKELLYPLVGLRATPKVKSMVYVPNNPENTSFFVWLNDPYLRIGQSTVLSGAFIPLSLKIKSSLNIRNRYLLDKVNVFSKSKHNRIGSEQFDSKVIISGNVDAAAKRLLSKSKIQKQILMALEIESYLTISINEFNIDFIPQLNNTTSIAILNPQGWEISKNNIENIFKRVERIRELID